MDFLINAIRGFCMALADSVPGVSGGTIAFILGFYDKFIGSINDLVYEKGAKRKEAFLYLVKLGFGWLLGMTILIGTISGLNLYAMKHPVEVISYEVRFTDPDHFSLTDYENLEENYIISREGKIYTLKERVDKDD